MRFFKIHLRVGELFDEAEENVGATDKEAAIALCKQEWADCGYEVLEVRSCEEVFPTSVLCERMIFEE